MRNQSNPIYAGSLEEAINEINANYVPGENYICRTGYEVEVITDHNPDHPKGSYITLRPAPEQLSNAHPGDIVTCSAIGSQSQCKIIRAIEGYPLEWHRDGSSSLILSLSRPGLNRRYEEAVG